MAIFDAIDWSRSLALVRVVAKKAWSRPPMSEVRNQINAEIADLDRDIASAESDYLEAAGEVGFAEDNTAANQKAERLRNIAQRLKNRRNGLADQLKGMDHKEHCDRYDAVCAGIAKDQERINANGQRVLELAIRAVESGKRLAIDYGQLEIAASDWLNEVAVNRDLAKKVWPQRPDASFGKSLAAWAPLNPLSNIHERVVLPAVNKYATDGNNIEDYDAHVGSMLAQIQKAFSLGNEVRASKHPRKFRKPQEGAQ